MFNLNKLSCVVIGITALGITACTSNPYSQPNELKFQNSKNGKSQKLAVIRDEKLCAGETSDAQNCPIKFYIDDIKSGEFYIHNSTEYSLRSEIYNLKAKNCTDECVVCETEIDVSKVKDNVIHLSVDEKGHPLILDGDQKLMCKTEQAVQPLLPETQTVELNLSADTLFKFDGSSLNDLLPQGYKEVVNVADQVSNNFVSVKHIQLIGHTDRLGTESYNTKLAANRAKTVSEVLIQHGISKNIISTKSMGESNPVTDGCFGIQDSKQLKECLQPDRRVTVEINGVAKQVSETK